VCAKIGPLMGQRLTWMSLVFVGGTGALYAVLWLLVNYTTLPGRTLTLMIPLTLLWLVICIIWTWKGRENDMFCLSAGYYGVAECNIPLAKDS
jgi:hypothetical protein